MCNTTPKAGETWVFRRDIYKAPVYNAAAEVVVEGSREHEDFDTCHGVVEKVRPSSFQVRTRAGGALLVFSEGWEPFLRLDEGETQEHPTSTTTPLPGDAWLVVGARTDRMRRTAEATGRPAPKAGERWHFRNNSGPPGGFAEKYIGVVEGIGDDWTVVRGFAGPALLGKAWKPQMKDTR